MTTVPQISKNGISTTSGLCVATSIFSMAMNMLVTAAISKVTTVTRMKTEKEEPSASAARQR